MDQIVTVSDLDWTIARLNRLTSSPAVGAITTGTAAVLLDLAEHHASARIAMNVTGA